MKLGSGAKRRASVEQRIKAAVVVPYDLDLCREYAKVKAETTKKGLTIPANDLWIATCAIRHSLPLITHNLKHFENIPHLNIISEANRPSKPQTGSLFP
jgi:predicted nucleic acid-binding protein